MIVPPVFPCKSVSLFVPVSRSPFSPGLHQARPQLSVYIRFTIHFRFLFSHPFHVCLSVPVCIILTLSFPFTSGHHPLPVSLFASVSRMLVSPGLHHSHPQLSVYIRSPSTSGFSFRLRFTCACQSRYSFCLLFSLSPFCPELSFPFLPSLSAPFCRPASPLPCSG